jgi:hypothetical protein
MKLLPQIRYRKRLKKAKMLMNDFFASLDLICDEFKTNNNLIIKHNDTKK